MRFMHVVLLLATACRTTENAPDSVVKDQESQYTDFAKRRLQRTLAPLFSDGTLISMRRGNCDVLWAEAFLGVDTTGASDFDVRGSVRVKFSEPTALAYFAHYSRAFGSNVAGTAAGFNRVTVCGLLEDDVAYTPEPVSTEISSDDDYVKRKLENKLATLYRNGTIAEARRGTCDSQWAEKILGIDPAEAENLASQNTIRLKFTNEDALHVFAHFARAFGSRIASTAAGARDTTVCGWLAD